MIKILLSGCHGKMGKILFDLIQEQDDMTVVAGVDKAEAKQVLGFPVFQSFEAIDVESDVIIDFSNHALVPTLLDYVEKVKIPAVIGTTGLDEQILQRIEQVAQKTAILQSSNMSLGINVLLDLVAKAARVLHESFDIEIIEKHHNQKLDAPSGTALMLANAMNTALQNSKEFVFGRQGKSAKREPQEIGIHAVRAGSIVGEHEIIFAGLDEVVEIRHVAASRKIFALGALKAAQFMVTKDTGFYTMQDVLF